MQHADALPQDLYTRLFDAGPDPIIITTPGGICAAGNRAAQTLLGYDSREFSNLAATAVVDLADARSAALFSRIGVDAAVSGTVCILRKDGTRFDARLSSACFVLADHSRWCSIALHELTAAESLQRELQQAKDHYVAIVEGLCEGVVVVDTEGRVTSCNERACAILGLPSEYLLGRPTDSVNWPAIQRDGSPFPSHLSPTLVALGSGKPVEGVEMGFYRPSGELIWLRLSARPLFRQQQVKPYAVVASFEDITQRTRLELELRRLAMTDPLTGVANRRALLEQMQQLFDLSRRTGMPASLLMLDIDNFKAVNDSYGHAVGDDVLKEIVTCIVSSLRRTDFLARIGGDEFCILLPDTSEKSGAEMMTRLEAELDRLATELVGIESIRVGVSIGLATLEPDDANFRSWLKRGDDACYANKALRHAREGGAPETL